jgi:hypothetical protein
MNPTLRRILLPIAAVAGLACDDVRVPVYRYINLNDGRTLRLGQPLPTKLDAVRTDSMTYALSPGTFGGGGTTSIAVRVTPDGVVREMAFVYDGSEALEEKVGSYTRSLGSPHEVDSTNSEMQKFVWQDSLTRFTLRYDRSAATPFWSTLIDRDTL